MSLLAFPNSVWPRFPSVMDKVLREMTTGKMIFDKERLVQEGSKGITNFRAGWSQLTPTQSSHCTQTGALMDDVT